MVYERDEVSSVVPFTAKRVFQGGRKRRGTSVGGGASACRSLGTIRQLSVELRDAVKAGRKWTPVAPVEIGPLHSGCESLSRGPQVAAGEALEALIGAVGADFDLLVSD